MKSKKAYPISFCFVRAKKEILRIAYPVTYAENAVYRNSLHLSKAQL